ncbi:hypothetical protein KC19_8G034400 [Ceratodon purpureus]|uniref:Uncharacterized protein n=1 Tax=Ceratodon purpureus TaxID=3225 RepID=A0A8T0GYE8_CERPU|nr:hypothetical protein KC19_8G034400 [Ceratodon purpureus]
MPAMAPAFTARPNPSSLHLKTCTKKDNHQNSPNPTFSPKNPTSSKTNSQSPTHHLTALHETSSPTETQTHTKYTTPIPSASYNYTNTPVGLR